MTKPAPYTANDKNYEFVNLMDVLSSHQEGYLAFEVVVASIRGLEPKDEARMVHRIAPEDSPKKGNMPTIHISTELLETLEIEGKIIPKEIVGPHSSNAANRGGSDDFSIRQ